MIMFGILMEFQLIHSRNTSWTFGTPNFSPGYPVSLFVKDDNGCTNTFTDYAAVSNLPNPDIS